MRRSLPLRFWGFIFERSFTMKIYSALQIGDYHLNHNEDYLFIGEIGSDKILCAVMDGCTMGTDSYFASTLVGKLLRKICLEKGYRELYHPENQLNSLDDYLKSILKDLFRELITTKNQLLLERDELLTTLIILLAEKKTNMGIVLAVGDGLVHINGEITCFDHDNKPDYVGFHLAEDFDSWYDDQKQKILFDNIQDICIATDGIFMFEQLIPMENSDAVNALDFLVSDLTGADNEDMLHLKLKKLEHSYGMKPTDDLAIIRIVK